MGGAKLGWVVSFPLQADGSRCETLAAIGVTTTMFFLWISTALLVQVKGICYVGLKIR